MAEKNLITKARLEQILAAESSLVDNLYQHVNASLSKAHGLVLYVLPHPFLDANGNDVSVYRDSHGDQVGYYYLRLTYNNTNYFAPLELSTLAGKDAETGISRETGVETSTAPTSGGTAWVTDFTPEDEQDLIVTNQSVLLPHTQLAHWETHSGGIYQITPQIITDSAGHRVSNYIARVIVDGVELWLPCDTRLGGPIQPVRVAFPGINTGAGTNWNYVQVGRDDNQYASFFYNDATGGDLPRTFIWQYNEYQPQKTNGKFTLDPLTGSGIWHDMPYSADYTLMTNNAVTARYRWETGNKLRIRASSGSDSKKVAATIRGVWTNAAGTTYTNWCIFVANDEDSSFFSGSETNQSAFHTPIQNDPVWVDGYYSA